MLFCNYNVFNSDISAIRNSFVLPIITKINAVSSACKQRQILNPYIFTAEKIETVTPFCRSIQATLIISLIHDHLNTAETTQYDVFLSRGCKQTVVFSFEGPFPGTDNNIVFKNNLLIRN